jgi:hypothetical protein
MARQTKTFDAVKSMRRIRDKLSRRFQDMSFEEQKRAMQSKQRSKPARTKTRRAVKRPT